MSNRKFWTNEMPGKCIKCSLRKSHRYVDDDCAFGSSKHGNECVLMDDVLLTHDEVFAAKPDNCPLRNIAEKDAELATYRAVFNDREFWVAHGVYDNITPVPITITKIEDSGEMYGNWAVCDGYNEEVYIEDVTLLFLTERDCRNALDYEKRISVLERALELAILDGQHEDNISAIGSPEFIDYVDYLLEKAKKELEVSDE